MTDLTEDEIAQVLVNYLGRQVRRIVRFETGPQSDSPVGYLGHHLRLTVDFIVDRAERRVNFFLKTHNLTDRDSTFLEETGIFQKEVDFYCVIVDQVRGSVGEPTWCPRACLGRKRILVLEDLRDRGFVMADGGVTLDESHVKIALKTMARMHASSMLLERIKSRSLISAFPDLFREVLYDETKPRSPTARWVTWQIDDLLAGVDYLDKYTKSEKLVIKEKFSRAVRRIYPLNKVSTRFRNVLTHGDVWKNNLMFRYEDRVPVEGRLVDFQFFRYAPPAHDVMNFLHFATRLADRKKNETSYLDEYYKCLSEEFEARGMLVRDEVTREDFFESCRVYKELGTIQSLLSMHYILGSVTVETDNVGYDEYDEYLSRNRNEYMKRFFETESYADKITEGMCEFIDNYIIKN